MSCRLGIDYRKKGKVCIRRIRNRGTDRLITVLEDGGKTGMYQRTAVTDKTDIVVSIRARKTSKTDTPLYGYIAGYDGTVLVYESKYEIGKTSTLIQMPVNTGDYRTLRIGLLFDNPVAGDAFIMYSFFISRTS